MSDLFGNVKRPTSRTLLAAFDQAHRAKFDGLPAPLVGKRDGPLAARLMGMYSYDDLALWAALYFEIPDRFIQQGGYTFGLFSVCIGKVIQYDRRRKSRPATVVVEVTPELVELRQGIDARNHATTLDLAEKYFRDRPWLSR